MIGMMEPIGTDTIAERVQAVLSQIGAAAVKVGRSPGSVTLVAATKTVSVDRIGMGLDAGLSVLGENRVQEALSKIAALKHRAPNWHYIGQLQRRKVRSIMGLFELIHSVDSVDLAREVNRRAEESGTSQDVLLEVNIGNEPTKAGFSPGAILDAMPVLAGFPHIRIQGLMTVPPFAEDPEKTRPSFRQLRLLAQRIADLQMPSVEMRHLSMGMSNDYAVAVEEGATLVRIGTAIFGARHV